MAKCINGCPPGTDMRTCKSMEAGDCPFLLKRGSDLLIGKETVVNTENFGVEQLMNICKQVNDMKIVEEYEPA